MNTVRAWKDPEYRAELSEHELDVLAANPAGVVELSDHEIEDVVGAALSTPVCAATISVTSAVVTVSLSNCVCSTVACGSCAIGTRGCC